MKKRNLPLSKVYTLIETGPVVLLTTADKGRPNVMTLAWHTMRAALHGAGETVTTE